MFPTNLQLPFQTNALPDGEPVTPLQMIDEPMTPMQVSHPENSIVFRDDIQNGGLTQASAIVLTSEKLQDDLRALGVKMKKHEDNIKLLKDKKNKLDESIRDIQAALGKYHLSSAAKTENNGCSNNLTEEETNKQILRHEKSAAGILCQLKSYQGMQVSNMLLTKDVLGIVATLGNVDDENFSRLLSEYLGVETMLAIVCRTFEGVKALETYNSDGSINKDSGLHGLGASIGRALDGRFLAISLENLRPFSGDIVADDPQRRLDLVKPRLPNGELPPGFIGFAVNMIILHHSHLFRVCSSGYGIRETLFYNLFSHLQVYRTREEMILALPCISNGAISLDGGLIKRSGFYYLGSREDNEVRFPRFSIAPHLSEECKDYEKRMKDLQLQKETLEEDIKREQALLDGTRVNFQKQKEQFVRFLAESSSYATQYQFQGNRR